MYEVNDYVLYADVGVCQVREISKKEVPGSEESQLYYTLQPLYQECVIHTPVENRKVFMRAAISKKEAEALIDKMPDIEAEPFHGKGANQLTEYYTSLLNTRDLTDLVELTMSIYAKRDEIIKQKRKLSVVDERFMKRAEELLFGELAVALSIEKREVPAYIFSRVGGGILEKQVQPIQ